jgi:hypothetical protein
MLNKLRVLRIEDFEDWNVSFTRETFCHYSSSGASVSQIALELRQDKVVKEI